MHRPILLTTALALFVPSLAGAAELPLVDPPRPQKIAGGEAAQECAWPDTVAVTGGGGLCTGTLVHPRLVTYAAHCGDANKQIKFGESSTGAAYTRQVERCLANPDYVGTTDQAHDWAFCVLAEPITEIPFTPPLYGCELEVLEPGLEVVIAGFGNDSDTGGSGTKRWATTTVVSTFGNTINIGGDGTSTCSGDSGGSAFVQMADGSWRAISMVSTGVGCGLAGVHALMHPAIPWIESESGIDITPCHDAEGNWQPSPNCDGFFAGGSMGYGSWENWCAGTPRSGPASTCGEPFDAIDDVDPPVVTITSPTHGDELESGTPVDILIEAVDDGWGVKDVYVEIDGMAQPVRDTYPPYAFEGVPFPDGAFTIVAVAEDWGGNVGVSDPVTIGVGAEVPDDPMGTTGSDDASTGGGLDETGTPSEPDDGSGTATDGTPQADGGGSGSGCACTHRPTTGSPWGLVCLAFVASRRRSRR